jgi:alpha-galactosidase
MDAALEEPVIVIKAAWGGLTLSTNFRPPCAGPYVLPKQTLELWAQNPEGAHGVPSPAEREKWRAGSERR